MAKPQNTLNLSYRFGYWPIFNCPGRQPRTMWFLRRSLPHASWDPKGRSGQRHVTELAERIKQQDIDEGLERGRCVFQTERMGHVLGQLPVTQDRSKLQQWNQAENTDDVGIFTSGGESDSPAANWTSIQGRHS